MKKTLLIFLVLLVSCSNEQTKSITIQETSPKFLNDVSTCYSIFPISYADSNGDNVGDLNGITEKLPTLANELNIDCIWLNPVHPSESYHKYDVDDYYSIDEEFGTIEDYKNLIDVANENGISVIMDFVINHSSDTNPLFIDYLNGENEYYSTQEEDKEYIEKNWYSKNGEMYYASFWEQMPEFNFNNEEVRDYFEEVAKFWLENGVSGFRVDAAYHIYDTNEYEIGYDTQTANVEYFKEFNSYIKSIDKDTFLILEVWQNQDIIADYYSAADSLFNFELSEQLVKSIKIDNPEYIYDYLSTQFQTNSLEYNRIESNFISNHDQNRLNSDAIDLEQNKLAANISLTLPGITWIYYGEDLGMEGMKPDENIREPYKWSEATKGYFEYTYNEHTPSYETQKNDPSSLYNHYVLMTGIRKEYDFSSRKLENVVMENDILSYELVGENDTIYVVHNFSDNAYDYINSDINNIIYGDTQISSHSSLIYSK